MQRLLIALCCRASFAVRRRRADACFSILLPPPPLRLSLPRQLLQLSLPRRLLPLSQPRQLLQLSLPRRLLPLSQPRQLLQSSRLPSSPLSLLVTVPRISVGNCSLPRRARKPQHAAAAFSFSETVGAETHSTWAGWSGGTGLLADLQVENGSPVMALQRHRRGRFNVLFFRTSKHVPIMSQNNPRRRAFSINSAYSDWGQSVREVKSMRTVLFSTAVIAGIVWMGIEPANAGPQSVSGIGNTNIQAATVESVGYRRRFITGDITGDMGIQLPMRTTLQHMAIMCLRPHTPTRPQLAIIHLRTAITPTLHLRTGITRTLRLRTAITPTLHLRTGITRTLRLRKVTSRTTRVHGLAASLLLALIGHSATSDLSPQSAPKRTLTASRVAVTAALRPVGATPS